MTGEGVPRVSIIDAAATRAGGASPGGPYRPVPRDFVERWPQVGWSDAKDVWRCHSRTVARWVDECGRERMVLARKRYKEAEREVQARARRQGYRVNR